MNENVAPDHNEELAKLEILRVFKKRFAGEDVNYSPFTDDRVIRYDTSIEGIDVPEIHHEVREEIQRILKEIHAGQPSKIVILAGEPGMGKTHLLNYFRSPALGKNLQYVLIGNSNFWDVKDFEACLLDWILDALLKPSLTQPHLLLEKIESIAFESLRLILERPGKLRKYLGRKDSGFWRRQWERFFGAGPARFQKALAERNSGIFRKLNFDAFANFVIERFLPADASKPFHRHVLKCLLLYLFPEEREKVIHWLRRKPGIEEHFVKRLGIGEDIQSQFQVVNTIQILISLFSPEISKSIQPQANAGQGLAFFFAFDQMEGRQELFDEEKDWFKFFAKLSELYNSLPNIFLMFTMTLNLRNQLYPKMERQFQSRIVRDSKFVLREIKPEELRAIYCQRVQRWLGDVNAETIKRLEEERFRFLPFTAEEVSELGRGRTLREFLEVIDIPFRKCLDEQVVLDDPRFEYLVSLNELRERARGIAPFKFTENHLTTVIELMNRAGGMIGASFGLAYKGMEQSTTEDGLIALRLEFRHPKNEDPWIRVFIVRLKNAYTKQVKGCIDLISGKIIKQNFLWLVRPERIDANIESQKSGQVFARVLHVDWECSLQAILRLLDKSERFKGKQRKNIEAVMIEALKPTYLGELLDEVASRLAVASQANGTLVEEPDPNAIAAEVVQ